ncbi:hypothetical protein [Streptomyces klenkii]|uniref:hypothetical protein n=1 Tax=Streptomyces klenkii TaxID=1420899 RepID=UPI0034325388
MPSRRRRHARLIATLTDLIGDCAAAAGAVYRPVADAPPEQVDVPVDLWPLSALSLSASTRLDVARAQDAARWPTAVVQEQEDQQRTFAARCAAAEGEQILYEAEFGDTSGRPQPPGVIPLSTVLQSAAMALAGAGADFLTELLDDPEQAISRLHETAATGEFTTKEILDEATDMAVMSGLMSLREAQRMPAPSTAAEGCLAASRSFALAVFVASAEAEATTP